MRIQWEVDDGYVSKDRPKFTTIPDEDIAECEDMAEAIDMVYSYVDEDYHNNISYHVTNLSSVKDDIKKLLTSHSSGHEGA